MSVTEKKQLTNRQIQATNTKMRILISARSLFSEKGFENATIEEITEKAGTSKGLFYSYFKSKEDLLANDYMQVDEYYLRAYDAYTDCMVSREKILNLFKECFAFCLDQGIESSRARYSSMISNKTNASYILDADRPINCILAEVIQQGQEKGEITKKYTIKELVELIGITMRAIVYQWCLVNGTVDVYEMGEQYFDFTLGKSIFLAPLS